MEKLISMTDFFLSQQEITIENTGGTKDGFYYRNIENLKILRRYAKFLSQPLELYMFTPCDENGKAIQKPKCKDMKGEWNCSCSETSMQMCANERNIYNKALERVLFEGFEMTSKSQIEYTWGQILILHFGNGNIQFSFNDYTKESLKFPDVKTIEDLVIAHELKLTETAKKQIGL